MISATTRDYTDLVLRRLVFSSTGDRTRVREALFRRKNSVVSGVARYALDSLVTLIFPSDCRLCGLPLATSSFLPVCPECLESLAPISGDRCLLCGERLFAGVAQSLCGECLKERPPFERASAYGSYEGGVRELIHLLKYDHVLPAAKVLGRMLAEAITDLVPEFEVELPLVVPVPLHESKLRQRGFNQSELMAKALVKQNPVGLKLELSPKLLVRKRPTDSQTGLTRQQRVANLRGAFGTVSPNEISGRNILLVDDVFTTGTTVSECARVLRRAGAQKVWVATVARVLKSEVTFARAGEGEQELVLVMAAGAH